eukprot:1160824-Pelagomonas_calceolata.AAC.7
MQPQAAVWWLHHTPHLSLKTDTGAACGAAAQHSVRHGPAPWQLPGSYSNPCLPPLNIDMCRCCMKCSCPAAHAAWPCTLAAAWLLWPVGIPTASLCMTLKPMAGLCGALRAMRTVSPAFLKPLEPHQQPAAVSRLLVAPPCSKTEF